MDLPFKAQPLQNDEKQELDALDQQSSERPGFIVTPAASCKSKANSATTGHIRGSLLLVAGRVLAILLNFAVQIMIVRYLDKANFGVLAFALTVASILAISSSFGMDKSASRFLAVYLQERDYARFWGMLVLMLSTVTVLGIIGIAVFASVYLSGTHFLAMDDRSQLVLAVISGLALCDALDALFVSLFAVMASPKAIFLRRHLLGPLLKLAAAGFVIAINGGVVAFAVGQLAAGLIGLVICIGMLITLVNQSPELRNSISQKFIFPVRLLFSYSLTLLSGDLAFMLRGALVPLVLGLMFVGPEVASYQAVVPFARLNEFVLMTFSVMFLPNASRLIAVSNHSELQRLFEKTTIWVTILSFPIFAGTFLASNTLPTVLFGPQYATSGGILAWLALGYFANAAFGSNLRLIRASGKLHTLLTADLILSISAAAAVFALVPRYGALGGAWAVCGAYLVQSVLYQVMVAKQLRLNPFSWRCVAPFAVGVTLCVAALFLVSLIDASLFYSLLMAVLVSLLILFIFGRELDLRNTFPELYKLPVLRRWKPAVSSEVRS